MGALKYYNTATSSWEYVDQPGGANSTIVGEAVTGGVEGANYIVNLSRPYIANSVEFMVNGLAQKRGTDFFEHDPSLGKISVAVPPASTDVLTVNYFIDVPPHGNADTVDGYHLSTILDALYPVGSVYVSGSSTMPSLVASIGTWVRLNGRVIVGVDETQAEFDTVNETGGAKTHTLTTAELPSHNHGITQASNGGGGNLNYPASAGTNYGVNSFTENTGSGQSHNNLQPYKAKYMWERTA